jgi:hypothetical protein
VTRPRKASKTVVRSALRHDSSLQPSVCDGLGAVATAHRNCIEESVRAHFNDSLDLDEALREGHEQENRWDYLLGHSSSGEVIGIEPHSAKQDQISTVIKKRKAALVHLRDHLRDGARVSRWLWVASGRVDFANTAKTTLLLAQNGIQFVGRAIREKDLR